jgi:hypothetical protein
MFLNTLFCGVVEKVTLGQVFSQNPSVFPCHYLSNFPMNMWDDQRSR